MTLQRRRTGATTVSQADPAPAAPLLAGPEGPRAVEVVRDGVVESVHRAVLAVTDPAGRLIAGVGGVAQPVYPRSAVKPAQAAACLDVLTGGAGPGSPGSVSVQLDQVALAIGAASHGGGDDQQIEAAHVLALAGLDETALACPAAVPAEGGARTPLAHNCSGTHALMLLAGVAADGDPARSLNPEAPVQQAVRRRLAGLADQAPGGPGVDGCGAPAWRLSLAGLARMVARTATASEADDAALAQVAAAMRAHPELVGGDGAVDTALMRADPRVVAKRGAEGVLVAGVDDDGDGAPGVGVAVKVLDGASRATGPLVAAVLAAAGVAVPAEAHHPLVLGGGVGHGSLRLTDALDPAIAGVGQR